jgi:LmbE family N-acetylglucosaminyl deacetylase
MPAARLLVVTAHPDDEVLHFGGLTYLTARAGGQVTLVCATRGEVGEIADTALATTATLGAVRETELRAAAALLGVQDVRLLDYRDSGMAGTPENEHPRAFVRAAEIDVVPLLVRIIREQRPTVVATWAPDGGYGHPDHVAASRHATAAFDLAGQGGSQGRGGARAGRRRSARPGRPRRSTTPRVPPACAPRCVPRWRPGCPPPRRPNRQPFSGRQNRCP